MNDSAVHEPCHTTAISASMLFSLARSMGRHRGDARNPSACYTMERYVMSKPPRIRCDSISYRKGFIEVIEGIHDGLVNVETWRVPPAVDASKMALDGSNWEEGQVQGNTELELTPTQARALAQALLAAANLAEGLRPPALDQAKS